jgi:hypothetical protein
VDGTALIDVSEILVKATLAGGVGGGDYCIYI